jgi:hypothetical protein
VTVAAVVVAAVAAAVVAAEVAVAAVGSNPRLVSAAPELDPELSGIPTIRVNLDGGLFFARFGPPLWPAALARRFGPPLSLAALADRGGLSIPCDRRAAALPSGEQPPHHDRHVGTPRRTHGLHLPAYDQKIPIPTPPR